MSDEWDFATKFRDVIVEICESVIERSRPDSRYATVISIDRTARTCKVRFPGETDDMTIAMGSIQPAKPGQTVRIAGTLGDRYVDDVMGEAIMSGGVVIGATQGWTGTTAPANYVLANGAYYAPATYPGLFAVYGYSIGQQGSDFRVPTIANTIIRAA